MINGINSIQLRGVGGSASIPGVTLYNMAGEQRPFKTGTDTGTLTAMTTKTALKSLYESVAGAKKWDTEVNGEMNVGLVSDPVVGYPVEVYLGGAMDTTPSFVVPVGCRLIVGTVPDAVVAALLRNISPLSAMYVHQVSGAITVRYFASEGNELAERLDVTPAVDDYTLAELETAGTFTRPAKAVKVIVSTTGTAYANGTGAESSPRTPDGKDITIAPGYPLVWGVEGDV